MSDESDQIEEFMDQRPLSFVMVGSNQYSCMSPYEDVKAALDAAGPDDYVEFDSMNEIGRPPRMVIDACKMLVHSRAVSGIGEITKASWREHLQDKSALSPMGLGLAPPS